MVMTTRRQFRCAAGLAIFALLAGVATCAPTPETPLPFALSFSVERDHEPPAGRQQKQKVGGRWGSIWEVVVFKSTHLC